jgi:hypothetical protein
MELDEMKLAWQSLEQQMERHYALDLEDYRERKLTRARRYLLPVKLGLVLRIVLGIALIVFSASFWAAHIGSLHLVVSGVLLQGYGLLLVLSAAWEMQLLVGVDYAAPVLAIQRRLERLRSWRLRTLPIWVVTGCFVWIPMTLIVFKAWLGADIYQHAPEVVLYFVGSGVIAMVAFWIGARWIPGATKVLGDGAVGGSLDRSQQFLKELARFEFE